MITQYLYDHESIIIEYENSGIIARYTHGLNIDEPLAIEKGSQMYFYHADGLGSITALTNSSGTKVQSYAYDSFGNITPNGTVTQPFTYTGREFDPETGLYYYRARYYDPRAGRFLQRDPIGFDGGDVNLYVYVKNNPVNRIDPLGLVPERIFEPIRPLPPYNPGDPYRHKCIKCDAGLAACLSRAVDMDLNCPKCIDCTKTCSGLSPLPRAICLSFCVPDCVACSMVLGEVADCFRRHCRINEIDKCGICKD